MTIREYWEAYDALDNPFDESVGSYQYDRALTKALNRMELRLRGVLSKKSNETYDARTAEIFNPANSFGVYMRQANDILLSLLESEAGGANAEERRAEKLPPFSLTTDIEEYYRANRAGRTPFGRLAWRIDHTGWFGVKYFILTFPMKVRYYFVLIQVLVLTGYRRMRGTL